jgi:hypothetical protein
MQRFEQEYVNEELVLKGDNKDLVNRGEENYGTT